jgi:hypothetical protein
MAKPGSRVLSDNLNLRQGEQQAGWEALGCHIRAATTRLKVITSKNTLGKKGLTNSSESFIPNNMAASRWLLCTIPLGTIFPNVQLVSTCWGCLFYNFV